ncbi:MAG TPA: YiaA/YiaB family inner membrane protein [Trebonia sp.]|nr:YiaA/YiaB family inner membrane protein [Trebonia sp.]
MSTPLRPRTTTAFYVQAAISFCVSLTVMVIGIGYLSDSRWVRGFLALGLLYVVTSSFTLAKCIRDRQEEITIVSRVDQAKLDKFLADQDVLQVSNPYQ